MSKPTDLLGELDRLESLRNASADPESQRQFRRFIIRGEAALLPMSRNAVSHEPIPVQLRDVSRNGIGFLCGQPLAPRSVWRLEFTREGYTIGESGISVRHCEAVGRGVFLVGGQFVLGSGVMLQLGIDAVTLERDEEANVADADEVFPFVAPDKVA